MRYYRCKCGKRESWGSDPPWDCQGCKECNTTLTGHPDNHKVPIEHDWITETKIIEYHGEKKVIIRKYCGQCYTDERTEKLINKELL